MSTCPFSALKYNFIRVFLTLRCESLLDSVDFTVDLEPTDAESLGLKLLSVDTFLGSLWNIVLSSVDYKNNAI